jgi:hypothetical protein
VDATQDYPTCDALDVMGGTVGVTQGAFTRDLSDGDIDSSFTLNLGTIPVELSTFSAD